MRVRLDRAQFPELLSTLHDKGYRVIGPQVRDGAIVYDTLTKTEELPIGWTDRQEAGTYQLERRDDEALFGYVVGPQSWRKEFIPPKQKLWTATKGENGFTLTEPPLPTQKIALLGVRSCELKAIEIQDRVFRSDQFVDPVYHSQRKNSFLIAVNCVEAGNTCFCVSMDSGPKAKSGYDLSLTEVLQPIHHFVMEAGSDAGQEVLDSLTLSEATSEECQRADDAVEHAAQNMGRTLDTTNIKDLLYDNAEHSNWSKIADRCMSCANCTLVCPTCFCTTVEDTTDLTGENAERWRRWDSCFNRDFSYVCGGPVRHSTSSRYRQWMTHKLAAWHDQFGTSGCVGCGRCVTWCPVGIDITQEVEVFRSEPSTSTEKKEA